MKYKKQPQPSKKKHVSVGRNTVIKNLNKTHPISQINDAGKQKRIEKFTIDSFKETVQIQKIERKAEKIN